MLKEKALSSVRDASWVCQFY